MDSFTNAVAVITGAGSGIGRALAVQLAEEGARLALSDISIEGLTETARRCMEAGSPDVQTDRLDVADRDAFAAYGESVLRRFDTVNLVFNNAGVALSSLAVDNDWHDVDWVLGINLGGVLNGTQVFLPHLIGSGDGHLVNISSLLGLIALPTQSIYNASKFAVRGYTEAIRQEMDSAGHNVGVHCVHPGGVATNIARASRASSPDVAARVAEKFDTVLANTSPEDAARIILRGVRRGRSRIIVGPDALALYAVSQATGTLIQKIVPRLHRKFGVGKAAAFTPDVAVRPRSAGDAA